MKVLSKGTNKILKQLDKDGNGIIDMIEGDDDFMKLLRKHQSVIIEFDKKEIKFSFIPIINIVFSMLLILSFII